MELKKTLIYWMILLSLSALMLGSVGAAAEKEEAAKKGEAPSKAEAAKSDEANKTAEPSKQAAPGEVDITDIQDQYWKAHDKEFEVIQNKQYSKAGRFELAPVFGLYQRVDFQDTKTYGAAAAYHFSETWGVELMGYKMSANDSRVLERFKETRGATIEFNEEKHYFGASALFTPIYGKFSLLGKKIAHFDIYLAPGVGATKTIDYNPTFSIGVGQKFWLTPRWNFRVEYRWMRYTDKVETSEGITARKNGGSGYYEDTITNQNLIFGISYLFN